MPTSNDPYKAEPDDHACTEPLEDEDGRAYRICQEPVGGDRVVGGGEFPDPATPPRSPAPGSARSGTALSASDQAENAEVAPDPDRESEDPEEQIEDQVDRLERHNRPATSPIEPESPPRHEAPPR